MKHLVIFVVGALHWLIPDMPREVKDQIERENLIKQRAMWQINPNSLFMKNMPFMHNDNDLCFKKNMDSDSSSRSDDDQNEDDLIV
jgi:hypothetical protein